VVVLVVAALVAIGGSTLYLRRELFAAAPRPVAPADLTRLDLTVRRLVEMHLRIAEEEPSAANHGTLGLVYEANGLWSEAERSFALAAELAGEDSPWPFHRGVALAGLGEFERARVAFEEATEREQDSAAAHHRLADLLLASGALDEALPHFEAAVRHAPESAEAHAGLGTAYYHGRELELARSHLERAIELDPSYRSAHYQLGLTYREFGFSPEEVERELALGIDAEKRYVPDALEERVQAFRVGYSSVRRAIASLLESGRTREGIAALEALQKQRPTDVYVLNDLALAYLRGGDAERAHALLLESKAIDEREFATWTALAACAMKTGNLDQALAYADRAVELAGPVASAHLVRGNVLAASARFDEAYESLRQAVRFDARNPDAHHALALVCANLGRYDEARDGLESTTTLDPERWEAFVTLARVNVLQNDLDGARAALARAQRIAPQEELVKGMTREIERHVASGR
jgi:tetratricopeptide (TPR) repeat protein